MMKSNYLILILGLISFAMCIWLIVIAGAILGKLLFTGVAILIVIVLFRNIKHREEMFAKDEVSEHDN